MIEIRFHAGDAESRSVDAAELGALLSESAAANRELEALSREDLLRAFSKAYQLLTRRGHALHDSLRGQGLAYFLSFIHSQSLGRMLDQGLASGGVARPRGVVGHWLAGNVPILGMLSAVLSLITRNRSVFKLPSQGLDALSPFLATFMDPAMAEASAAGKALARACTVLRFQQDQTQAQQALADHCDARIVWGSREAVEAVRALTSLRRPEAETVAFGPKLSACLVDPTLVSEADLDAVSRDASLFLQLACTSPHCVFVLGGESEATSLAVGLDRAFARLESKGLLPPCDESSGSRVLEYRGRATLAGARLLPGHGTAWSVLIDPAPAAFPAWGFRLVTVVPVAGLDAVAALLPANIQTLGCRLSPPAIETIARHPGFRNVCRLTRPGHMHDFSLPWDGIQVLERLVHRLSLEVGEGSA